MENHYLSMAQAAHICTYDQEYLGLLARRGLLRAEKINRKWYTTREWLNEYLKEKRPNEVIAEREDKMTWRYRLVRAGLVIFAVGSLLGGFFYWRTNQKINALENKTRDNKFILNEIVQIPDDNGNINTYGSGMIKIDPEEPLTP